MPVYKVYSRRKGSYRGELWDEVSASSGPKAIYKAKKRAKAMKKEARSKSLKSTLTRTHWRAEKKKSRK